MWEVTIQSKKVGKKKSKIVETQEGVRRAILNGVIKERIVSIDEALTDIIIFDRITGDFLVFKEKISPREAASYSILWAKTDRDSGCMFWPHGKPFPEEWKFAT